MSTERTPAWTRADLDSLSCQTPGCQQNHHHGPTFLGGRCHPKKPQDVEYRHGGVLVMHCHACGLHTLNLRVAPDVQQGFDAQVVQCGDPKCTDPPESHVAKMRPPCHRMAGVHVTYHHGAVHLACGQCQELMDVLPIKERTADA